MKPSAVVALLACALVVLPAGASGAPAADGGPLLLVNYFGGSGGARGDVGWVTWIAVHSEDPMAAVTLTAPSGYPVTLDHAPGTRLGDVNARVSPVGGGSELPAGGQLVVESSTRYASDPTAQACAPGAHAAVWRVNLAVPALDKENPRRSFELPIFVDRAAPGASLVLRFCPIWRTAGGDLAVESLSFTVEGVLGKLTARGWNTWRALVSPPLPTLAADEARTFEMRAHEPIPHRVTVRARHDARKGTVVVSGDVTAAGRPEPGATLTIWASREWAERVPAVGTAKTNAAGEFSFLHGARVSTVYLATGFVDPRACGEPSSAPAGCASETVAEPRPGGAPGVRIRRPSEARLAERPPDQALADRIGLKLADLRAGWREWSFFSRQRCRAFNPDLTSLTATGWSESGQLTRRDAAASSRVTVYVSEKQARIAFDREARLEAAQCLAGELRGKGLLRGARAIEGPIVGDETRAFRIVLQDWSGRSNLDLISFRRGRAVVHLAFEGFRPRVEHAVAAKLAARARRG